MSNKHGEFKVALDGDIIEVNLSGSFNQESMSRYCSHVKELVNSMRDRPFAMLVNTANIEGGTPEAYAELQAHNQWLLKEHALVARAIVINDIVTRGILGQRAPAIAQQNTRYFENVSLAKEWLLHCLDLPKKQLD